MNSVHWHLVVNHLPIIFPIVGIIVLIIGLFSKSESVKRTAFIVFILGAVATIVAMATGEGAEDVLEKIGGVTEKYIKNHEESAETFAILSYILGCFSFLGLWASFKQKTFSWLMSFGVLIFALLVLYFAQQTGTTGGKIIHTEIRNVNNAIPVIENSHDPKDKD